MKRNKVLYFHRRKDTGKVFYVGVGNLKRAKAKDNRNQYWHNIVNKVGYDIQIVHTKLTWEEACKLETQYIKDFGRWDLGLGMLVNMTDGGDGVKSIKAWNKGKSWNKETKQKISKKIRGENHRDAKLTEEQVLDIRKEYNKEKKITQLVLAEKYGVSRGTIQQILNRKIWKHI